MDILTFMLGFLICLAGVILAKVIILAAEVHNLLKDFENQKP